MGAWIAATATSVQVLLVATEHLMHRRWNDAALWLVGTGIIFALVRLAERLKPFRED